MSEKTSDSEKIDNSANVAPEGDERVRGVDAATTEEGPNPEKPEDAPKNVGKFHSAVSHLKDLKELIAILVFFVGGAVWIYTAFATKQYVAGVRCLLASTIERIDNEAQSRELKSEIIEVGVRQHQIRSQGNLSTSDILEAEKLSAHMKELENRKALADRAVVESSARILQGECEQ